MKTFELFFVPLTGKKKEAVGNKIILFNKIKRKERKWIFLILPIQLFGMSEQHP